MKYLFYSSSSILMPHLGVLINEAIAFNRITENEVIFSYCNSKQNFCISNIEGNKAICTFCNLRMKTALNTLPADIKRIPNGINVNQINSHTYVDRITTEAIQAVIYKNVNIGYSVASAIISITRNPIIRDNIENRKIVNALLNKAVRLVDFAHQLILQEQPTCIVVYNGRYFDVMPFIGIAQLLNINFVCYEVLDGPRANKPFYIESYRNSTPFNMKGIASKILNIWDNSDMNELEKFKIAQQYFTDKRNGKAVVDISYTAKQLRGCLPKGFDQNKKNIVIFNSSEDEFASIGKEFASHSIFDSQYVGIKYILEAFKDKLEYQFYVRVHPNLTGITHEFCTKLYELSTKYKNITIIYPEDVINSYDLMHISNKIIVFGSTIGVESVYWNKPVILLAGALYYHLDICYTPHNAEEVIQFLKSDLKPKNNINAVKYGFYELERLQRGHYATYYDLSYYVINLYKKRKLFFFKSNMLYGSVVLNKVVELLYRGVFSKLSKPVARFSEKKMSTNY